MHKRFLLESIPLRDDRRQMNGFKLKLWINAQFSQEIIGAVDKVRSPLNHQIEFPLATQAHRRRSSVSNGDSKRTFHWSKETESSNEEDFTEGLKLGAREIWMNNLEQDAQVTELNKLCKLFI